MICFNCGLETENSYPICDNCKPIEIDGDKSCEICGYPQSSFIKRCSNCSVERVRNRSLFLYTGIAKDILRLYKFSKKYSFARFFSGVLIENVGDNQILCPVPTSFIKRRIKSGYQLDPILKYLKKCKKIKVINLLKKRYSTTQKNLSREDRLQNLRDSFQVINKKFTDKDILLFDDVYTTGATMESCYNALLNAGYKNVRSLTLYHD